LVVRYSESSLGDYISGFSRKTTLEIEVDSCLPLALSFLDFGGFRLLVCLQEPRVVVLLEFSDIRMRLLLSNFDRLIPLMKLLIHSHGILNFIISDQ
jgi:hypothetical protein